MAAERPIDLEALRAAQEAAGGDIDEDVFDEVPAQKEERTAHHIRANSSIMHLKKILGELVLVTGFTYAACPIAARYL